MSMRPMPRCTQANRRPFLKSILSRSPWRIRLLAWVFLALDLLLGAPCRHPRGPGSLRLKASWKRAWRFPLQQPARAAQLPSHLPQGRSDHGGACPSRATWRCLALLQCKGHRQRLPPGPQGSRLSRALPRVLRARLRDLPPRLVTPRRPQARLVSPGRCCIKSTLQPLRVQQEKQLRAHARSCKARPLAWVCPRRHPASGLGICCVSHPSHMTAHVHCTVLWSCVEREK